MPNKNYLAGRRFEWKVRKVLEAQGWTVMRTAGSKGPVDLIAVQPGRVQFVQCKNRTPTKRELESAKRFAAIATVGTVVMAWPPARGMISMEWVQPDGAVTGPDPVKKWNRRAARELGQYDS